MDTKRQAGVTFDQILPLKTVEVARASEGSERFLPSERSAQILPSERSEQILPSERSDRFLRSERSEHFLPSEGSERIRRSEGSEHFLPSERSERIRRSEGSERIRLLRAPSAGTTREGKQRPSDKEKKRTRRIQKRANVNVTTVAWIQFLRSTIFSVGNACDLP